ncbi:MAG: ComEC/Rec2 family competence protein [Patescibacteria group bacterium]
MSSADAIFFSSLAFLGGVASASFNLNFYIFILITALVLFFLYFLKEIEFKKIALFSVALFFGIFYFHFWSNIRELGENLPFGREAEFQAEVMGEPRIFEKYAVVEAKIMDPFSGRIDLFLGPFSGLNYGDMVSARGVIEAPRSSGERAVAFFPQVSVIREHQGYWLKGKLIDLKNFFIGNFKASLPPDEASLLGGITFGSRSSFSSDLKDKMSLSGTTHIVALSGYNIAILVFAISSFLGYFFSRRLTFYFTAVSIFIFVIMVGAEPSVVRAAIMGFLALAAGEAGRIYNIKNAIAITASAMVLINPFVLVYDIGFELSFVSLLGIVYLYPSLKNFLKSKDDGFMNWREIAVLTLSAQLAVLPIIVRTFGNFSLTSVLANVLILEFIPLTMLLGFLLAAASSIYFYLGFFVSKFAEVLLSYEIKIIEIFSGLRLPLYGGIYGSLVFVIVYYLFMVFFIASYFPKGNANNK